MRGLLSCALLAPGLAFALPVTVAWDLNSAHNDPAIVWELDVSGQVRNCTAVATPQDRRCTVDLPLGPTSLRLRAVLSGEVSGWSNTVTTDINEPGQFVIVSMYETAELPQVAVDNVMATARNASNLTSDSVSFSVGAGSDRYLLVGMSGWDNTSNVSGITITYNGVPVPRLTGGLIPSGNNNVAFWGLKAPASGANTLALANIPAGYAELAWAAVSFTGVNQTTPVSAIVTDAVYPFSVNVTLAEGDLAMDVLYGGANTPTVGAGQTERSSLHYQSVKWFKMSSEGGSGSVAMSWSAGSNDGALAAIVVRRK